MAKSQENENWMEKTLHKFIKVEPNAIFYLGFPCQFKSINANYYGTNKQKLKAIANKVDPCSIMSYGGTL